MMDIWEWVESATDSLRQGGQARLADLIDDLPPACCDGQHDRVESLVPEALALARVAKHPWLEVFIRHWLLQSRVLHRHDVSHDTLAQAVSLVEFASRADTQDCPQSICAVQDLCSAYGLVDGVGYAEQRLAVTAEALSRIEPARPCFDCVSAERASALLDAGRYQEALEFCDRQLSLRPLHTTGISGCRFSSLTALGRHREAQSVAERIDLQSAGASGERTKALYQCLAAARLGEPERALQHLIPPSELEPEHFVNWLRCARALGVAPGRPNTWRVERHVANMHATLTRQQSYFTLTKVHKVAAELAVGRGSRFSALRHLEAARAAAEHLVDAAWVRAKRSVISAQAQALTAPLAATSPEDLRQRLDGDPEHDLELLTTCGWADDAGILRQKAAALDALGASAEAQQELERAARTFPADAAVLLHLLESLLESGDHQRLEQVCAGASGEAQVASHWPLARSLAARGEIGKARGHYEELLRVQPEHHAARASLAHLLRDAGELDAAAEHLDLLVAAHEPGDFDWDRALVATLREDWPKVRESARRLQLPVDPDEAGPIDERWGACRIRVKLADGRERAFFAWRTGPVTARIDEVVEPGEEQHHADLVAFDAAPLNAAELEAFRADPDAEASRSPLCEYAAYRVLEAGNFRSFDIDGFMPGAEQLARLKQELTQAGVAWEQRSGERYQLSYEDEERPATYAFLGLPPDYSEQRAHAALGRLSQELSLRLVWPKLAAAAGDAHAAAEQRALAALWGIE